MRQYHLTRDAGAYWGRRATGPTSQVVDPCGTMLSECIVSFALGTQKLTTSPPVDEANLSDTVTPRIDLSQRATTQAWRYQGPTNKGFVPGIELGSVLLYTTRPLFCCDWSPRSRKNRWFSWFLHQQRQRLVSYNLFHVIHRACARFPIA